MDTQHGTGDLDSGPPTVLRGLTAGEAELRLREEGPNRLPGSAPKSLLSILRSVAAEPMFIMLLCAGGIYLLLGDKTEAAFLMASVLVIIAITLAQERKTQRALESLRDLSAPRALVIRDQQKQRIAGQDVVRGDLLVLHEGDRIAADGVLVSGNLSVDESLLSGESVPVLKLATIALGTTGAAATEQAPPVFASTVVTKGEGIAQVTAIGAQTAIGKIGQSLGQTQAPPAGLALASRKIVWQLTALGLFIACLLFLVSWLWDDKSLLPSLLTAIALVMAILPEEIPVVLTVFLALGAWRMSRKKVLTRQVAGLEALGAITILAVDKTGTITQNRMKLAALSVEGNYFFDNGAQPLAQEFQPLCHYALLASPSDPFDPMEKAILDFARRWLNDAGNKTGLERKYDLSADTLAMTNVYAGGQPSDRVIAAKGAPEAVLDLCRLPQGERAVIQQRAAAMAGTGLRVLGVAKGSWQANDLPDHQREFDFSFLGLLGFADPPRPDVREAISDCHSAGIRVVMMTGDHPATAKAIGEQVGLSSRLALITGAEIDGLNDAELADRLKQIDLCARLKPEQKLRLVKLLQANGEVVAMTGDGVNDAPALHAAHVGIAMGERGTDVAREAADLVLLDDSFVSIVLSIRQGRRIHDNITSAIRFIFAVHVPVVALAFFPPLFHWPLLLLPIHIVLLELIIDPACSIVFEAEPEAPNIMKRPPRKLHQSPFSFANVGYALAQGVGISAILLLGYWSLSTAGGAAESQERLIVFVALVAGILLLVMANRNLSISLAAGAGKKDLMFFRLLAFVAAMLLMITMAPLANRVLHFDVPGLAEWGYAVLMIFSMPIWLEGLRRAGRRHLGAARTAR